MNRMIALGLLVLAPLSAPAVASPLDSQSAASRAVDENAKALKALETVVRFSPGDGGACIELANAYLRAGRVADAASAYHRALALDNVMLETRTGDAIWSHQVARQALAGEMQLTAR